MMPNPQSKSFFVARITSTLSCMFGMIAGRRWASVILIGVLAFAGSAAVGLLVGIPEPRIHDEFSYLLAAETFASGRLTNPPHPRWIHFETFHVIHQPTYVSKYPPAQGLVLALGRIIAGKPIVGVWMSFGMMCAAITWMLYGWTSARWALFGGVIAVIHPTLGFAGYWAQSYWGGAVAATGGALLLGGARRIMRRPCAYHAVLTAMGLAILANSRPYEGLILGVPVGFILLAWMLGNRAPPRIILVKRILIPILSVLIFAGAVMGAYNFRVTGDTFRFPYQIHERTYAAAPLFFWQKPPHQPAYRYQVVRELHVGHGLSIYHSQRTLIGFIRKIGASFSLLFFNAINILAIPFMGMLMLGMIGWVTLSAFLAWSWRNRWSRRSLYIYFVFMCGLIMETFSSLHYLAPIVGLNYFFVLNGLRLWRWRNRSLGQHMLWLVPLLSVLALSISLSDTIKQNDSSAWHIRRAQLLKQLQQQDEQHLVIVRYGPQHSVNDEWVYNEADIDAAKVVFARHADQTQDCRLADYFHRRRIWSLDVDMAESVPELKRYPTELCN
jgi:hypothetical protein